MGGLRVLAAALGAFALGVVATRPVEAAVVSVSLGKTLTAGPVSFALPIGGGLQFAAVDTGYGPGAAVTTIGGTQVTTIFGQVADYFPGTVFDGTASYAAVSNGTIQYSAADDFIGFSYIGTDGLARLGYAEVFGPTLVGFAYETTAGASIVATSVPEPASIALILGGIAGVTMMRRRRGGAAHA